MMRETVGRKMPAFCRFTRHPSRNTFIAPHLASPAGTQPTAVMELSKLQRELISRCAMAVLGLGLMYGGYRCLRTAWDLQTEYRENHPGRTYGRTRSSSGAGLPSLIGYVLVIAGAPFALAAFVPTSWFARVMGPPNQFTLHENPSRDNWRGPWR
jgi:hypothetical protein